jgi:hypothetical protein
MKTFPEHENAGWPARCVHKNIGLATANAFRVLRSRRALRPQTLNVYRVDVISGPAQSPTLCASVPETWLHAVRDQATLQLSNCTQNGENQLTCQCQCIHLF